MNSNNNLGGIKMTIVNKTNYVITTSDGGIIRPNESGFAAEHIFNTVSLHSEIGSCIITTEYSFRSFKYFGKIVATEGKKSTQPLDNGLKEIIVSEV